MPEQSPEQLPEQSPDQPHSPISFFAKCLGISIFVVALAGAYRVATGDSAFSMSGDKDGFKITLEQAQQELKQASEEINIAQDQVKAQTAELEAASKALSDREAQLNSLVVTLQRQTASAPVITPEVRSGLSEMNRTRDEDFANVPNAIDTGSLDRVDARLRRVEKLSQSLER
jgi:multidrug resistance efflux pump